MLKWYYIVLKNYAVFSGRASLKEFWYFTLVNIIITIVLGVLDILAGSYMTNSGIWFLSSRYGGLIYSRHSRIYPETS